MDQPLSRIELVQLQAMTFSINLKKDKIVPKKKKKNYP